MEGRKEGREVGRKRRKKEESTSSFFSWGKYGLTLRSTLAVKTI